MSVVDTHHGLYKRLVLAPLNALQSHFQSIEVATSYWSLLLSARDGGWEVLGFLHAA